MPIFSAGSHHLMLKTPGIEVITSSWKQRFCKIFMFFINFKLIPAVLFTSTNCCFHDQLIPPLLGVLSIKWRPLDIDICNFFTCLLFFWSLWSLPIFMFFMIFQRILPILLTPHNYCFQDQVTPSFWLTVFGQSNLYQTWYGVQWFSMMTTRHGFSVNLRYTKIWWQPDLPLQHCSSHLFAPPPLLLPIKQKKKVSFSSTF